MASADTDGYEGRIEQAMVRGRRPTTSVRELARRVSSEHPDLRGATHGGIRQYVAGNIRNPRIELLKAIAEALGVRADWLAFGEGEMTEAENRREGVETGAVRALLELGALRLEGEDERVRGLTDIIDVTDDFPDLPQGAKDIITRFLWDVCTMEPDWFTVTVPDEPDSPGWRQIDEGRLSEFAKRFFPDRIRGSYGEQMAQVLAHAQVAYLTTFGSQLDNREE